MDTEVPMPLQPGIRESGIKRRNVCFYSFMNYLLMLLGELRINFFFCHAMDPLSPQIQFGNLLSRECRPVHRTIRVSLHMIQAM